MEQVNLYPFLSTLLNDPDRWFYSFKTIRMIHTPLTQEEILHIHNHQGRLCR